MEHNLDLDLSLNLQTDNEELIQKKIDDLKTDIRQGLINESKMLELFDVFDHNIGRCDKKILRNILYSID